MESFISDIIEKLSDSEKINLLKKNSFPELDVEITQMFSKPDWCKFEEFSEFWEEVTWKGARLESFLMEKMLNISFKNHESKIQKKLYGSELIWDGLSQVDFSTPIGYIPIILKFSNIQSGQTICDIGSGYGNLGHFIGLNRPEINFVGYEQVAERNDVALKIKKSLQYENVKYFTTSFSTVELNGIDIFYMYDPLSEQSLQIFLDKLKIYAQNKEVIIIAISGETDFLAKLVDITWLKKEKVLGLSDPNREVFIFKTVLH